MYETGNRNGLHKLEIIGKYRQDAGKIQTLSSQIKSGGFQDARKKYTWPEQQKWTDATSQLSRNWFSSR
ncbi:hypothetical protein ElyMa_006582800 [Elysia marginata]|uniref:Uncharacterized protein n=1 Tax=Elysia marginata TaxID=1093978 RepID=A0AAV4IG20_9GAST|nr:hypothetical protein ElyMa_006582800 [Elysia marginata]